MEVSFKTVQPSYLYGEERKELTKNQIHKLRRSNERTLSAVETTKVNKEEVKDTYLHVNLRRVISLAFNARPDGSFKISPEWIRDMKRTQEGLISRSNPYQLCTLESTHDEASVEYVLRLRPKGFKVESLIYGHVADGTLYPEVGGANDRISIANPTFNRWLDLYFVLLIDVYLSNLDKVI